MSTLVAGAVHARLDEDTGFALHGDARLTLAHVREDGVELDLESGRVSNQVRTGTVYAIGAGEYSVHVRGTVFEVVRDDDAVAVTVDEGVVEVRRGSEVVAPSPRSRDVGAPSPSWRRVLKVRFPFRARSTEPSSPYRESDTIVRWELDGSTFEAVGALSMRVPLGALTLTGFDDEGERWVAEIEMLPEGVHLEESSLERVQRRPAVGYIAPEAIQAVVQPDIRRLQRCYERTLDRHPALQGVFSLRVHVRRDGSVGRVGVNTDGDSPERFTQCLRVVARQWVFPEPEGGPSAFFNLPLNFATR